MSDFTALMPHGAIEEVFDDVFFVTGTSKPTWEGQQWQFSRNMTIVRDGSSLTLVNTVRLDDAGLKHSTRSGLATVEWTPRIERVRSKEERRHENEATIFHSRI